MAGDLFEMRGSITPAIRRHHTGQGNGRQIPRETGVCRGAKPLCRGFGGVPQLLSTVPHDWGTEGVEEPVPGVLRFVVATEPKSGAPRGCRRSSPAEGLGVSTHHRQTSFPPRHLSGRVSPSPLPSPIEGEGFALLRGVQRGAAPLRSFHPPRVGDQRGLLPRGVLGESQTSSNTSQGGYHGRTIRLQRPV